MRKKLQRAVGLLVSGLLALGVPTITMADNLSPDTPYSHQGNTSNNQSGTPAPAAPPAASSAPTDPDSYNSEFHNSFQTCPSQTFPWISQEVHLKQSPYFISVIYGGGERKPDTGVIDIKSPST